MADKPVGTDLVTKLNAANMQPLWDMVWDGLGETPVPTNVRAHIQAQPVSPSDGKVYVASGGGWVVQNPQDIAGALAGKLDIAGGTIQGTLRVNGAVTLDSPATVPVGAAGAQVPQVQEVVKKSGDTMTGQLSLPDPTGDSNPTLLGQFASQRANPGYIKLPGGLIIQWGTVSSAGVVADATFPIPFPTVVLNMQMSSMHNWEGTGQYGIGLIYSATLTGFRWAPYLGSVGSGLGVGGGHQLRWLAIGC